MGVSAVALPALTGSFDFGCATPGFGVRVGAVATVRDVWGPSLLLGLAAPTERGQAALT